MLSWTTVPKPESRERHRVAARRQLQEHEAAIGAGGPGLREVGVGVDGFDVDARDHRAGRIGSRALDDARRDRLRRQWNSHHERHDNRDREYQHTHHTPPCLRNTED